MSLKLRPTFLIILVLVIAVAIAAVFFSPFFEGEPPEIIIDNPPAALGVRNTINFKVEDKGKGLRMVRVYLKQGEKKAVLLDQNLGGSTPQASFELKITPLSMGFNQGQASLVFEASDSSFRGWGSGNQTVLGVPLAIDTIRPTLRQSAGMVYITRGGSAVVVYEVSEPSAWHGVKVGQIGFQGYHPWPEKPKLAVCMFAFPVKADRKDKITLWAADAAGNKAEAPLRHRLRWKHFRHSRINLSDNFLEAISTRFASQAPLEAKTPLAVFKWVNEKLRQENDDKILAALGAPGPYQHWNGPLLRAMGSRMAGFGDKRSYYYKGKFESKATHLGIDLAHTANSPVPAAANGLVRFADHLGIYGNCVVLDHGMGLYTLYGHLSQLVVKAGDRVKRGQELGLSGATGLALGDHLHFSVLVQGEFVDPTEWWDEHWVADNVMLRYEQAAVPVPMAPKLD